MGWFDGFINDCCDVMRALCCVLFGKGLLISSNTTHTRKIRAGAGGYLSTSLSIPFFIYNTIVTVWFRIRFFYLDT